MNHWPWHVLAKSSVIELSIRPDLIHRLVPPHAEQELLDHGIDVHHFEPLPADQFKIPPSFV